MVKYKWGVKYLKVCHSPNFLYQGFAEKLFFMPPFKKGACCFATVGRSVCRSVEQVLSGQYLFTPSLDQYQIWCRGCPQWVDDPYWFEVTCVQRSRSNHSSQPTVLSGQYLLTSLLDQYQTWFSGHMFKGQGQTTLLSSLCCPLNIFWPLHLINTKLGAGVALNE